MARRVAIGTSPVQIVPHNSKRSALSISNPDALAIMYLDRYFDVTTSEGDPLHPKVSIIYNRDNGDNPTIARYGVSDTAGKNVRVSEEFQ